MKPYAVLLAATTVSALALHLAPRLFAGCVGLVVGGLLVVGSVWRVR